MVLAMVLVLMSRRELDRVEILGRLNEGRLTASVAAELMGLSECQTFRLLKRLRDGGAAAIANRGRGKPSNNRYSDALRRHALSLVREHYPDFGPTLATEKLAERHDLRVSRETLRQWMIEDGLWLPRAERRRFHQPRHRREHYGELIQIDGSEHAWFEDRGPKCTLLVFIDDATSTLMQLLFVASESTFSYFDALERYLAAHGKPVAFYSDKHTIFKVAERKGKDASGLTQFGRALDELNIEILCANTSQAKGRVERAHKTLQDRLVKELRLAGIDDIEAANAFLPGFMAAHNARFAKPPARELDLHRPLREMNRLDDILCWRVERHVSRQLVVHYNQMRFSFAPNELSAKLAGKMVEIFDFPDGRLEIRWKGIAIPYTAFDKLQRVSHAAVVDNKRLGEVLAWVRQEQQNRSSPNGDSVGPKRSHQKKGIMRERLEALSRPQPTS